MFMFFKALILQVVIFSSCCQVLSQSFFDNIDVTTVIKEKFYDKEGNILTGKGVVIGDVDSGIDIFHPMFFFADGGEYSWTDINNDGAVTFGTDGIDLNNNGKIDQNEVMRYIEMRDNTWGMLTGFDTKKYNPAYDFIYIDANNNKKRDFGPESGFTENDPAYGEMLFIAEDKNNNGKIESGEKLIALKTSKIRSVKQKDGQVRRRGIDLIYCEPDTNGHGTGVAGLIIGGHYGVQKIHGIAPDAEMVFSTVQYDYTPRFVRNFPDLFGFLRDEKVNILLIEDGEWMYEFMDGSSPEEEILNQMARDGVTIIGGAGNFTGSNMMIIDTLTAGKEVSFTASAPKKTEKRINDGVFFTFLWPNTNAVIKFTLEAPDGKTAVFSSGSGFEKIGDYNIYYAREVSPKGTVMFRFGCSKSDSGTVYGSWKFNLLPDDNVFLRAYVVDVSQSWEGTSRWKDSPKISDASNICFPSTADSCMAIGAYVVNFGWFDKVGDICSYSSRGYNIYGKLGIDVTGPGHTTLTCEKDNGYMTFSGTSSAAPHVVGTAALLLQYEPSLTHTQIKNILHNTAIQDKFTGRVPNPVWGFGKLSIENAIKYIINN